MTKHQKPTNPNKAEPAAEGRRRFDATFKQEAVALGKRIGISQAAQDLGISEANLRNWTKSVSVHGTQAFLPISQRTDVDSELRRLRERVRVLEMERDILKKAAAYFAKENE